jgi:hypothetical protein
MKRKPRKQEKNVVFEKTKKCVPFSSNNCIDNVFFHKNTRDKRRRTRVSFKTIDFLFYRGTVGLQYSQNSSFVGLSRECELW